MTTVCSLQRLSVHTMTMTTTTVPYASHLQQTQPHHAPLHHPMGSPHAAHTLASHNLKCSPCLVDPMCWHHHCIHCSDTSHLGHAIDAVSHHGGLLYLTSTDGFTSGGLRPARSLAAFGAYARAVPWANEQVTTTTTTTLHYQGSGASSSKRECDTKPLNIVTFCRTVC